MLWFGIRRPHKKQDKYHHRLQWLTYDATRETYILGQPDDAVLISGQCGVFQHRAFEVKGNVRVLQNVFTEAELVGPTALMKEHSESIVKEVAEKALAADKDKADTTKLKPGCRSRKRKNSNPQNDVKVDVNSSTEKGAKAKGMTSAQWWDVPAAPPTCTRLRKQPK